MHAAAAGIMFCQMQQLCSLTSMSWLQSCSFYGQPPLSLSVILSQPQEMMNNILVVSIQTFLLQSTLTLKHLIGTTTHIFSHLLCKNCLTYLMFSLHFLAASDNQLEVYPASNCLRFPVFDFRNSDGFPSPASNVLL